MPCLCSGHTFLALLIVYTVDICIHVVLCTESLQLRHRQHVRLHASFALSKQPGLGPSGVASSAGVTTVQMASSKSRWVQGKFLSPCAIVMPESERAATALHSLQGPHDKSSCICQTPSSALLNESVLGSKPYQCGRHHTIPWTLCLR